MTIQSVANAVVLGAAANPTIERLNARGADLAAQLASGVTSADYAGLGDQRYTALDLQPQVTRISAWQQGITAAQATLSVTQVAMSSISDIATSLQASLVSLQGDTSEAGITAAATTARSSLSRLATLLNTTNGSQYVFSGTNSTTVPIPDPSNITGSSFFTAISASVAALARNGAGAVEADTVAAASSNASGQSVFSSALSVSASTANGMTRTATVGELDHVTVGFVATQGSGSSATSTGSPIRDLMRLLAVVGSLDTGSAQAGGFATLVRDSATQMSAVSSSLTTTITTMGITQTELTSHASELAIVSDAFTKQLGAAKDADVASLSSEISANKDQLTASYSLIADMKTMTLTSYI